MSVDENFVEGVINRKNKRTKYLKRYAPTPQMQCFEEKGQELYNSQGKSRAANDENKYASSESTVALNATFQDEDSLPEDDQLLHPSCFSRCSENAKFNTFHRRNVNRTASVPSEDTSSIFSMNLHKSDHSVSSNCNRISIVCNSEVTEISNSSSDISHESYYSCDSTFSNKEQNCRYIQSYSKHSTESLKKILSHNSYKHLSARFCQCQSCHFYNRDLNCSHNKYIFPEHSSDGAIFVSRCKYGLMEELFTSDEYNDNLSVIIPYSKSKNYYSSDNDGSYEPNYELQFSYSLPDLGKVYYCCNDEEELDSEFSNNNIIELPLLLKHQGLSFASSLSSLDTGEEKTNKHASSIEENCATGKSASTEVDGKKPPNRTYIRDISLTFYRKLKKRFFPPQRAATATSCNIKNISRRKFLPQSVKRHVEVLEYEMTKQISVIKQSSQALYLCHATSEFCNSIEMVFAERLLLIASQMHKACLEEIEHFQSSFASLKSSSNNIGTLNVSCIQLPLSQDFLSRLREDKIKNVHWFVCLLKHKHEVISTEVVSTNENIVDNALVFPCTLNLQKLPPHFVIDVEVYNMKTKRKVPPFEKKYRILKKNRKHWFREKSADNLFVTGCDSGIIFPSSFKKVGSTQFNILSCNRQFFALFNVPSNSILKSTLTANLQLEIQQRIIHKGFLTMFEDVGSYNVWCRYWCSLSGNILEFWYYPEDEQTKEPVYVIDLQLSATKRVRKVSTDDCVRPNTFQLVTADEGPGPRTRHLLQADSRRERSSWSSRINATLSTLRRWKLDSSGF